MNIWALDRDESIKHVLLLLMQSFGESSFEINLDDKNSKAVRLYKYNDKSLSIYLYTYSQEVNCYGVHLEYPDIQETSLNNTLDIYDNVNYKTLCNLIQSHLNIFLL